MSRHFHEEDIHMADKYMKRCLTSLAIREMQIKTMLRGYYTPIRIAEIKSCENTTCWQEYRETGSLIHCG